MPFWLMLLMNIPQIIKLIIELWRLLKDKSPEVKQRVRREVRNAVKECSDDPDRKRLVDRLRKIIAHLEE